ncbi:CEP97 [Mytilus coruscus]|uniref:Centrosomal protein of 97 kDa n=1 Tax=Mytilus coruscus TaxID=42192 RepID=A0A6J8BBX3_MYTCO|nr:CEP97 [Mytilus coruscus]
MKRKKVETDVLNLSSQNLSRIQLPLNLDPTTIILDKNNISKIENLQKCHNLKQLSVAGNRLVRMNGVSNLTNLTVLNLPNNSIVSIEGLKDLTSLAWLNLSGNSIKAIENLGSSINLRHLDLSDNSVSTLTDISHLQNLRTFLLHGNIITSLRTIPPCLPNSLCIFSLAENEILDMNEVAYLSCLPNLEQLSLMNNPCVLMTASTPGFDSRPYIVNWCMKLQVLDGYKVTEKERLKAEWIYSQGKGRHFKPGQHAELCQYLSNICPLTASAELESQEDAKLSQILYKQKLHQQQLQPPRQPNSQSPRQQNSHLQSPARQENNLSANSFSSSGQLSESSRGPPPAAQVAGWIHRSGSSEFCGAGNEIRATQCNDLTVQDVIHEEYETRSQTSLLDSDSIYIPISTRPMTAPAVSNSSPVANFQHVLRRENRPATSAENRYEAYDRRVAKPLNQDVKSKPNFQVSPPQQSGNEPAVMTKRSTPPVAQAHDYDTSQEVSQIEEIIASPPTEHVPEQELTSIKDKVEKRTRKATGSLKRSSSNEKSRPQTSSKRTTVKTTDSSGAKNSAIPVSRSTNLYRTQSDYIPGRYAHNARKSEDSTEKSDKSKNRTRETRNSVRDSGFMSRPVSDAVLEEYTPEEHRAAIMIQTRWRGYWTRQHHPEAVSVRKEMRAKRAEDHIIILRAELDKQRKLYEDEKHQRVLQLEALRYLWKEVQSLQSWKNEVLDSQSFKSTNRHDDSYSEEIQNTLQAMDTGRSSHHGNTVDMERHTELEKACASLQNQVAQLSQALQSVSSVVFQSGYFNSMDTGNNTSLEGTIMVTGYDDDDDTSSCEENTETEARWGTVPHSLSPFPSEEEEVYFMSVPQPGFPTPPRNVKLEHKGNNSVVMSWNHSKILDNMNRETSKSILGYRVFVDENAISMIPANMQKALLHGLDPNHTYKLYVKAVSALGESNMSNIIMAALSKSSSKNVRKCSYSSDSDNNRSDDSEKEADLDSTESSDVTRYRMEKQRRQKRIKSPRQDRRLTQRKESSASDQDPVRETEQSKSSRPSSRSGSAADGIFVQPKLHTHKRSRSRDSRGQSPDSELKDQHDSSSQRNQPKIFQPSSSKQSPPAGSQHQHRDSSIMGSKMSETFTIETQNSLMQVISAAHSQIQEGHEKSIKGHKRTRSKDLAYYGSSESVYAVENAPTSSPKPSRRDSSGGRGSDNDSTKSEKTHRRTSSKDYEWRKDIDSNTHAKKSEGHGVPVIDARKRHNSGSRPSSPAPSDVSSEKSLPDKRKTVAEFLEHRSSTKSTSQNSERSPSAGGIDNSETHTAALPPRHRKSNSSNEDIVTDVRRSPSKNSPTYSDSRRRVYSNSSDPDLSEVHSSSAARQLDLEKKTNSGIVSKLLQKLQTFSKSQEETLRERGHKIKKKSESQNLNPEEGRRPRRTSGSDQDMSQDSKGVPQSDSSSGTQSDDPQMAKKPYQTHRRSRSDQRVPFSPATPTKQNYTEPQWVVDPSSQQTTDPCVQPSYSQPPGSNVKRTASFHGVVQPKQPDVTPRRSGSEENINDKSSVVQGDPHFQQLPLQEMIGMFSRKQRQAISGVHHIPILSGAQLQKSQKQPPS